MTKARFEETARQFWDEVARVLPGYDAIFPRRIDIAIAAALPVTLVPLVNLSSDKVSKWLDNHGVGCREPGPDRNLRGCLIAVAGRGLIFYEANDEPAETSVTIAHEAAHFLEHYWLPRQRAQVRLGTSILPVLDGTRPPTPEERLSGVLRGCPFGQFEHLFRRDGYDSRIEAAEKEADELAFELLAPRTDVLRAARRRSTKVKQASLTEALTSDFGFPCWAAEAAANLISSTMRRPDSWLSSIQRLRARDERKSVGEISSVRNPWSPAK